MPKDDQVVQSFEVYPNIIFFYESETHEDECLITSNCLTME